MRSRLWLVALLVGGAAAPTVGATAACAAAGDRAALVVDTGENTYTYCVTLTDDSVSGLELIQLANAQHGLQYRFGDGGQAVCMLANVGAEGDDCFGEYPDFWGFWRGDGSGGWTWSSVGAGSTLVRDGDIQGWSWGSGQDGTTHPKPPPTEYEDVCPPTAASPEEEQHKPKQQTDPAPEQRKASGRTEEPSQKSDVPKERLTPRTATASDRTPGAVARPRTATASDRTPGAVTQPVTQAAAQDEQEGTAEGPPRTALLATALIAALGAAGAVTMKRRRS